jgi:hypothetical protein
MRSISDIGRFSAMGMKAGNAASKIAVIPFQTRGAIFSMGMTVRGPLGLKALSHKAQGF